MEIKFENDGYRFNVRSSCIIKNKMHDKVLLSRMRGVEGCYILPGGRPDILESTHSAISREMNEELGFSLDLDYKLISVQEDFNEKVNFHMLEFVYYVEVDDFDFIDNVDQSWDKFEVIDINDIESVDIRPKTLNSLIKQNCYNNLNHGINYDWGNNK